MKRHRKLSFLLGEGPLDDGHTLGVNCVTHSSDGRQIVTGGRDATVRVWEHGSVVSLFADHADTVHDVAIAPSTGLIASASSDHTVLLYSGGKIVDERVTHTDAVRKVKFLSSSSMISCSLDGVVCIHDLRTQDGLVASVTTNDPLFALAVGANDGKFSIFTGSARGHVYAFDPRAPPLSTECLVPVIRSAHKSCIRDMIFVDGGTKLVSCGADAVVKLWDTRMLRTSVSCHIHSEAVFSLASIPNTSAFVSGGRDGTVSATNIRTLQTSQIIRTAFPIFHVSLSPKNVLYVGSSRSSVDGYVLSSVLSNDLLNTPSSMNAMTGDTSLSEVITPSKIALDLDTSNSDHLPHTAPLVMVDSPSRRYESPFLRSITFSSPEEQQRWCSAFHDSRPPGLTTTEPDVTLRGRTNAILECTLLNDKRHVVTMDECRRLQLWNIIEQRMVHEFPSTTTSMKDAVEQAQLDTYCPSWCSVECRWGSLCVTVSFESSLDTFVNKWWLDFVKPLSRAQKIPLSTRSIARKERQDLLQQPLVNLGEIALRKLFSDKKLSIIVWSVQGVVSQPLQGAGKRFVQSSHNDFVLKSIPSWVSALLSNSKQALNSLSTGSGTHSIELVPLQKSLPALKQVQHNIPKRKSVAELAGELVVALKLKLPKTKEILDSNSATSSNELSFPVDPSTDLQEFSLSSLQPEEFIEFVPAGEDGQPNPTVVVDPMMMISTAFFVYKEKGSGVLRLWYRKNTLLPS